MFQIIEGRSVFVVDLPENPISLFPVTNDGSSPILEPYVTALNLALLHRMVTESGKYAIEITDTDWSVYAIHE